MTDLLMAARISPLPLLHHLRKLFEQIMRVVRAWGGLRVILHAEEGQIAVAQTFERFVVQVSMCELDFTLGQRIWIDGEVMVMSRDFDLSGLQIFHRMIPAVVAEFQLERLPAQSDSGQLMP
jgi:hypothetical protein